MIALFARHPTAANLLMAAMMVVGILALGRMNKQFFPDFGIDTVIVTVAWPGAGAEDVDNAVVQAIEPEVRFIDRVKAVISSSQEGRASIRVDFEAGADMQAALADVDAAVSRITTLPEDSETPWVRRVVRYENLLRVVLSGDLPERALKAWALRMRDGLIRAGVDEVETVGARDEWILVEADQRDLLALDLPLSEISSRIAGASRDIPGGDTGGRSVSRVRSLGLARTAEEVAAVEVRAFPDGRRLTVGEVAEVREAWNEDEPRVYFNGHPAVELIVKRATTADALETATAAARFLEEFAPTLPPGLTVHRYDEAAELIDQRIDLLVRNGLGGMVIVLIVLFVFLNARTAMWVAAGIPAALLAAMALAWALGHAINMVILFGTILAIGLVVDDAIVVAEHAETRARRGDDPLEAAMQGARRMAGPVFSSSLTTIAAFLPLVLIGGIIGQIIREIPIIVVLALVASLVECFLVLPGHLRHSLAATAAATEGRASRFRRRFDGGFRRFREGLFRRTVSQALIHRYLVLALAVGLLVVSIGIMASGRIGFTFFPSVEPNNVFANLRMAPGTTREETLERLLQIERGARAAAAAFGAPGIVHTSLVVGGAQRSQSPAGPRQRDGTVGAVVVQLVDSDKRDTRTEAFVQGWRERIGPLVGADSLTIRAATGGPPGREIDVRLAGDSLDDLKAAAGRVKALLASYPGVSAIGDDLAYGNREIQLRMTPAGRAMGFDLSRAGNQVRSALQGDTALRFARGEEEVEVRVRQKENPGGLGALYLFGPNGTEVPLGVVAAITSASSYDVIRRERGRREVAVTAEVNEAVTTNNTVLAALRRDGLAEIAAQAGLEWRFAGKAEEQAETFADMGVGAAIGLAGMFLVLAWIFGSYTRPLAVLAVVPLGFIGVSFGHFLTGFDLTILSMIGMIGLSGIVINDSIVLIVAITDHEREGKPALQAIEDGACDRLRAVMLTSLTTISGLLPLCFETSLQAQFLIPVALTIVAGLAAATLLILFVVPAMLAIGQDLRRLAGGGQAYEGPAVRAGPNNPGPEAITR